MRIFWHQEDLRLEKNLALSKACERSPFITPVFILDPSVSLGTVSRWWLHNSLQALEKEYAKRGVKLIFQKGDPVTIFSAWNPEKIYWNQVHSKREKKVETAFEQRGESWNGNHLVDLSNFFNKQNKPFKAFTPFYKAVLKEIELSKPKPFKIKQASPISGLSLEALNLLPKGYDGSSLEAHWSPGRKGALKRLKGFKDDKYEGERNVPSKLGTSCLSPCLHFGELSLSEVWEKAETEAFRRQLVWREFGAYFVIHFPESPKENWKKTFDRFPWKTRSNDFKKWCLGKTGYPFVDAGMRQLLKEGWMHNRLRMVVASFLVKDLLIDWRKGAEWFWDCLVDADLGNNTLGWQWVAGSGPDVSPFFRVFNPVLQGETFDPEGLYVKTYCPELKHLPPKWIHKPWLAPEDLLKRCQIKLGRTYPLPIVEHSACRDKAIAAFKALKNVSL